MADCVQAAAESLFVEYEKMPEDTGCWPSKKLNSVKKWVALEKVHGANFSFITKSGDDRVLVAKRGALLKEREEFFGIWRQKGFIDGEREKARRVFAAVRELTSEPLLSVTVYGELFGGHYPHSAVPKCEGVVPVQRAVAYCPGLNFYAYDIAVILEGEKREYIDYDVCERLFGEAGFLYATPLCTGSLQQMLSYPLGFVTTIPHVLGLPPLPSNIAEGIVVRPVKEISLMRASKGPSRVIFKRKVEQFTEKHSRHFSELAKDRLYMVQDTELMRLEMLALVTYQRAVNTVSKCGRPQTEDGWREISRCMAQEVLSVLRDEHGPMWLEYEAENMEELQAECDRAVQEYKEERI